MYDALIAAGAPEDKARKAAEAVATYENRFSSIENDQTKIIGHLNLVKWMVTSNLAFTVAVIVRLFA